MTDKYDYAIYGGGPTGLTLAYFLAKNKYKVLLVEKESKLGGCWRTEWQDNKYFTEHAPRVLTDGIFFDLLKEIGYDYKKKLRNTYGNIFETNIKFYKFFFSNFDIRELFIIVMTGIVGGTNITVEEWLDKYKFSSKGRKAFTVFCLALANSPSKLLVKDVFMSSSKLFVMFYNLADSEEWINFFEEHLKNRGVTIMKNTMIKSFTDSNNMITEGIVTNIDNVEIKINSNFHILTLPPIAFQQLLITTSNISSNWMEFNTMSQLLEESHYISFGFQFHFKSRINIYDKPWCWSCMNDYNIIILPVSEYLDKYSMDPEIKTVWSCTIVDTSVFIKDKNKTINDMTSDEIINNVKELLQVKPDYVTIYNGVKKINNKWTSKDSAFSNNIYGTIYPKGKLDNLYTVGPHNLRGITTIDKAVLSATQFLDSIYIENFKNKNYNIIFILIIIIIVILLYMLSI